MRRVGVACTVLPDGWIFFVGATRVIRRAEVFDLGIIAVKHCRVTGCAFSGMIGAWDVFRWINMAVHAVQSRRVRVAPEFVCKSFVHSGLAGVSSSGACVRVLASGLLRS